MYNILLKGSNTFCRSIINYLMDTLLFYWARALQSLTIQYQMFLILRNHFLFLSLLSQSMLLDSQPLAECKFFVFVINLRVTNWWSKNSRHHGREGESLTLIVPSYLNSYPLFFFVWTRCCSVSVIPLLHRSCFVCMSFVRVGHHNW